MANTPESVADIRSESFPDYQQRIEDAYIEGYDPVSLGCLLYTSPSPRD